jgi:hypothetical protein
VNPNRMSCRLRKPRPTTAPRAHLHRAGATATGPVGAPAEALIVIGRRLDAIERSLGAIRDELRRLSLTLPSREET